MNIIGRYERVVSKRPKPFIVILVIVTIFLSFFASQMEMGSGENGFQPDTEVARANSMIDEEYGEEQRRITVVTVSGDSVLSRDVLTDQLELEDGLLNSTTVTSVLKSSTENPSGISSPARLIAQAKFINRTVATFMDAGGGAERLIQYEPGSRYAERTHEVDIVPISRRDDQDP